SLHLRQCLEDSFHLQSPESNRTVPDGQSTFSGTDLIPGDEISPVGRDHSVTAVIPVDADFTAEGKIKVP
ncbi:hypothetical protein KI387_042939, partial [Taxus chinensis]